MSVWLTDDRIRECCLTITDNRIIAQYLGTTEARVRCVRTSLKRPTEPASARLRPVPSEQDRMRAFNEAAVIASAQLRDRCLALADRMRREREAA